MTAMVGANLEQMTHLETQFGSEAQAVTELINRIQATIGSTTWMGRHADDFRGKWEGEFKTGLNNLVAALTEAREVVSANKRNIAAATGQAV